MAENIFHVSGIISVCATIFLLLWLVVSTYTTPKESDLVWSRIKKNARVGLICSILGFLHTLSYLALAATTDDLTSIDLMPWSLLNFFTGPVVLACAFWQLRIIRRLKKTTDHPVG